MYEGHSINKGNHFEKVKILFFSAVNAKLFRFCLEQKLFLISQKYFFQDYSKSQAGMKRGLSSIFCWLRSANHVKFTEECVICTEKHVLVKIKKIFTNGLNKALFKRLSQKGWKYIVEIHWLSSIEKVPGAVVSKEGHAGSLLGYDDTYHYWFPWKKVQQ